MATVKHLDSIAREWVSTDTFIERCFERARVAETRTYRLKRLWRGLRTGRWAPTAADFREQGTWHARQSWQ